MYTMIAGTTPALGYARQFLQNAGIPVTDTFRWDVKHLLLDVPSFRPGGIIPDTILSSLPREITIWGGTLDHPALEGYHCVDLLKDEIYLTKNAAITADCTLTLIRSALYGDFAGRKVLIIGWGRIGKSLAFKMSKLGCDITVAARSTSDRAKLAKLGFRAMDTSLLSHDLVGFDMIINTVPSLLLCESDLTLCTACLKIDLASIKGIAGEDVIWARGLPGKYAPEQSGQLIAETFLRILKEEH